MALCYAFGCTKLAGIPTIHKTLVTDGWLVGGLPVVFGWRVGMVWALWDDVHAAENFCNASGIVTQLFTFFTCDCLLDYKTFLYYCKYLD